MLKRNHLKSRSIAALSIRHLFSIRRFGRQPKESQIPMKLLYYRVACGMIGIDKTCAEDTRADDL